MHRPTHDRFRTHVLGLMAAALLMAVVGCGKVPQVSRGEHPLPEGVAISTAEPGQYGGVFVLNETTQPTTFNPQVPNNLTTSLILSRLLSSLVEYDPRTERFMPALAERWEVSEDKKSYTFHLRRGILWSDGAPLTADDVVFTFDCILAEDEDPATGTRAPRYPSRYYEQYHINGEKLRYTKVDDWTIRFDLPDVYAPFIYDISQPILPRHKLEAAFENGTFMKQWSTQVAIETPAEIVGTGPGADDLRGGLDCHLSRPLLHESAIFKGCLELVPGQNRLRNIINKWCVDIGQIETNSPVIDFSVAQFLAVDMILLVITRGVARRACTCRRIFVLGQNTVEGKHHIVGGQRRAITPQYAAAQVEGVTLFVFTHLPALGQCRHKALSAGIIFDQTGEQAREDQTGGQVVRHLWVECRRLGGLIEYENTAVLAWLGGTDRYALRQRMLAPRHLRHFTATDDRHQQRCGHQS